MTTSRKLLWLAVLAALLLAIVPVSAAPLNLQDGSCFVTATKAKTVSVRVGPGENRTPVAFLPTGKSFQVQGRFVAKDESVWYQIDPKEAAPKKAIQEAWVAAGDDLRERGDCEAVADADAPPIIPIIVQPTAAPATSGESAPPAESAGTTAGTITLRSGTWSFNFSRQSNASCETVPNFVLNTTDAWLDWTEADNAGQAPLSVLSATSFVFNETFFQSNGTNRYMGSWSFESGSNTQMYFTVLSPTSMVGQMVGNVRVDGVACSVTTDLTANRVG
ncbi:MAG: hypothetical protein JNM70_23865 [Anaerolineae bacterium]|nr:hypothetical protein [Anaerolineae bacterium]